MSSSTLPQIRASKEGLTKLRSNKKALKPSLDSHMNQDEYENLERKAVKKNHQALEQTMEEMNKRYAYNMKNIVSKLQDNKIKSFIAGVQKGANVHLLIDDGSNYEGNTNFRKHPQLPDSYRKAIRRVVDFDKNKKFSQDKLNLMIEPQIL